MQTSCNWKFTHRFWPIYIGFLLAPALTRRIAEAVGIERETAGGENSAARVIARAAVTEV
jgi:hypothetical protein